MSYTGWDFSSWDGALPYTGILGQFAYVKLTEGATYQNPYAYEQIQALQAQSFWVGYYHFLDQGVPVSDQINNFYNMCAAVGGTSLPLALDVEVNDSLGWQDLANQMVSFAMHVESWTNWIPNPRSLFYVNLSFYDSLAPLGFPWGRWVWLADPASSSPSRPCLIWQRAAERVAFDSALVDPDTFVGTDTQWQAFTSATVAQPMVVKNVNKYTYRGQVLIDTDGTGWVDAGGVPGWDGHFPDVVVLDETTPEDKTVPEYVGYASDHQRLEFRNGQPGRTYGFTLEQFK